jgi:hypothetical protein
MNSVFDESIADVQRYWDARPCNIRHSTKAVGSKEYFDEVEARKYLVEPHIPGFAEFDRWARGSASSRWVAASARTRGTSPAPALS